MQCRNDNLDVWVPGWWKHWITNWIISSGIHFVWCLGIFSTTLKSPLSPTLQFFLGWCFWCSSVLALSHYGNTTLYCSWFTAWIFDIRNITINCSWLAIGISKIRNITMNCRWLTIGISNIFDTWQRIGKKLHPGVSVLPNSSRTFSWFHLQGLVCLCRVVTCTWDTNLQRVNMYLWIWTMLGVLNTLALLLKRDPTDNSKFCASYNKYNSLCC